jgi:hypothetical protein
MSCSISVPYGIQPVTTRNLELSKPPDVGKFPPRQAEERGQEERGQEERGQEERRQEESRQEERKQGCLERCSLISLISFVLLNLLLFLCHRGRWVAGGNSAI